MIQYLIQLLFPRVCISCNAPLMQNEQHLCSACLLDLPQTRFHIHPENILEKSFWGRLPVNRAYAFLYFKKGGATQHILHAIKYKGNTELAIFMGKMYGSILREAGIIPDAVVAIPLHPGKQRKRGYNQSQLISQGIAEGLGIPDISIGIQRAKATETQTRKSRFDRWQNVEEVFVLSDSTLFENKHVLLIDDVITTGATIEACGQVILSATGSKLSVASIAYASTQ